MQARRDRPSAKRWARYQITTIASSPRRHSRWPLEFRGEMIALFFPLVGSPQSTFRSGEDFFPWEHFPWDQKFSVGFVAQSGVLGARLPCRNSASLFCSLGNLSNSYSFKLVMLKTLPK